MDDDYCVICDEKYKNDDIHECDPNMVRQWNDDIKQMTNGSPIHVRDKIKDY